MNERPTTASASSADLHALEVQLPVDLAQAVEGYVAQRPGLDPARLLQTALAQFLVQQGGARPEVRELYLDGLFGTGL
jgi:hypothetical protein